MSVKREMTMTYKANHVTPHEDNFSHILIVFDNGITKSVKVKTTQVETLRDNASTMS